MIIAKRFFEYEYLKKKNCYIADDVLYNDLSFYFQPIANSMRLIKIVCNYTDNLVSYEDLNENARAWYIERIKELVKAQLQIAV